MKYENLTVEREEHVAIVTLNRPQKRNALSLDLMEEIEHVAGSFRDDTETRVVIFRGAGPHFTAGADLKDSRREERAKQTLLMQRRALSIGPRMIRALLEIDPITIAAIQGGAIGGGACIVSALDFRIGTEGCFVSYPEINLGMNLSWVGLPLCVRLVGPSRAKRMAIGGQRESAQTLLEWGFLDEVVPEGRLMEAARRMAAFYAGQPPVQSQMIKRSVNAIAYAHDPAIMHMDTDQYLLATSSEDYREGVRAFFEKRRPQFRGA
jgi:enoyl-CoA hydratase/carnithine racemase